MKYKVEWEMVVDGVNYAVGDIVENPTEIKRGMHPVGGEAPKAKKAGPVQEILTEVSAPVDVLVEEELEAAPEAPAVAVSAPKKKKKGGKNPFAKAVDTAKSKIGKA